ncbi:ATP-binding cassette domain-containing protein [Novosphingobium sp. JCM 18896]|uniref:ATP-binding cassette domain-containing protein n=1 Tax=Novosphingobium sp. JCM 18896 TaxID=2989731 RepID=UPI0022218895|nr:ATP-binding cassette domain-containing protein [Novosphingobium sp. JCM 18896]MCW1429323.1 ATP-binding cassette domain-containing protein [Novosphingobium sp. JCM 18896]
MSNSIVAAIATLARMRRIDLRPDWADAAHQVERDDREGLDLVCQAIGWAPATAYSEAPRAHEFPLLVYHESNGWAVAERVESDNRLGIVKEGISTTWRDADQAHLYDIVIPLPAGKLTFDNAFDVFKSAVFRRKNTILFAVLATFVVNLIALVTSLYSMQVYDRVVPRGAFSTLWVLSIGAIVAILFDFVLRVIRANMLEDEAVKIDTEVSEFFFSRTAEVRLDARPPSIGTTAAQLKGLEQVRVMLSSAALFALADLPFAVLFILVIAKLGGIIAVVMAISFPIAIGVAFVFAKMIREDTAKAQISGNRKNGLLVESLDAAETVKANRGQWYLLSRWNRLLEEVHEAEIPVRRLQTISGTIFGTLQQISYICLIAWGAVEVFENHISMGALIACSILSGRVNGPLLGQLPSLLVQWTYSKISLQMLDGILQLPVDRPADVEQLRPNRLSPALSFTNVGFAYPGARTGVGVQRLEIAAGERIGIIGGVGSGKSTLLKLMAGLYAPQQGQILMDRLDMNQIAEDVLRGHIGYLPQDYRLVNGSLRDNITLGLSDPGDEAIMEAARGTGLAGLITAHPRGLDLQISEGGRGLSGGQRVLTGLTRLLLAKPKLILLDEPTANLDVDTEALVLKTLAASLQPDTTLILVTHKLQLVNMVGRVFVMANGSILLDGPTGEVMKRLQAPAPAAAPPSPPAAIDADQGAGA